MYFMFCYHIFGRRSRKLCTPISAFDFAAGGGALQARALLPSSNPLSQFTSLFSFTAMPSLMFTHPQASASSKGGRRWCVPQPSRRLHAAAACRVPKLRAQMTV